LVDPKAMNKRSLFSSERIAATPETSAPNREAPSKKVYLIGVVILAGVIALPVVGISEIKDVLSPWLVLVGEQSVASTSFTEVTAQQTDDLLAVQMKTDDAHTAQLCDQVMETIYVQAEKNPGSTKLQLVLQIAGKPDVTIQVNDLDAVRHYQDKKAYSSSGHRSFVGAPLLAAGLVSESSLTVDVPTGAAALIGSTYEVTGDVHPRLGVRFIDDTQVDILKDGTSTGPSLNYTIQGNTITVPTSCNTLYMQMQGDGSLASEFGTLTKQ
jgi:hypothetical protein